jgi:hypothetical protein
MTQTESAVYTLLFEHDCVVIPGFGGFIKRENPTVLDTNKATLKPKGETVFFNGALQQNDGLLANHIALHDAISFQDAFNLIQSWVTETEKAIVLNGRFKFGKLGTFYVNAEGKKWFAPDTKLNFSKKSFGLETIIAKTILDDVQVELEKTQQKEVFVKIKDLKPKVSIFYKIAASFLVLTLLGGTSFWLHHSGQINVPLFQEAQILFLKDTTIPALTNNHSIQHNNSENEVVDIDTESTYVESDFVDSDDSFVNDEYLTEEVVTVKETEQPFVSSKPSEMKPNSVLIEEEIASYTVLAGAFMMENNAVRRTNYLKKQGFEVFPVKPENSKLTRIQVGNFTSKEAAQSILDSILQLIPEAYITTAYK